MLTTLGLVAGLACSALGLVAGRVLGTALTLLPFVAWFGALAVLARDGLSGPETTGAALTLLGCLLGLFIVQGAAGLRRTRREH